MNLTEAIDALERNLEGVEDWPVVVLNRADDSEVVAWPIFDVKVDDEDREINLLTGEGAESTRSVGDILSVRELLARFRSLVDRCSDYQVFSGTTWIRLDDEHEGRLDVPLIGIARNVESRVFGFMQGPRDQWRDDEP